MFSFFKTRKNDSETTRLPQTIKEDFSNPEIIADYFKLLTGVTFEKQKSILNSKLISFCRINKITSYNNCLKQLESDSLLRQKLVNYLTTNETYFYREFRQINEVVKKITSETKTVDILCAPCSSGEESYSIVLALLDAGVSKERFRLVGIDINTEALDKAKKGVYQQRNISKIPLHLLNKYFEEKSGNYILNAEIKNQVQFKAVNIFDQEFTGLGRFDYIFSRNLLIYFDTKEKNKAIKILESLLKESGSKIYYGHADLF